MKIFTIAIALLTLSLLFWQFRHKDMGQKLWIALGSVGVLIAMGLVGSMLKSIEWLFWLHRFGLIVGWIGVLWYLLRDRFYGWMIFSPLMTFGIFLLIHFLLGFS